MDVDAQHVLAALREVGRHGSFFDLLGTPGAAPGEPTQWRPLPELPTSAGTLEEAVDRLGTRLGAPDRRPIASLIHMSAAAQLASPLLATAVERGLVPDLEPDQLRFGFADSGALRLRVADEPSASRGATVLLAPLIVRQLFEGPLRLITDALNGIVPLSPQTTVGNVASVLAAGARLLDEKREDAHGTAVELLRRLLQEAPLRGAGTLEASAPAGAGWFRRSNCCLFYRIPGGGTCGDCVLAS